MSLPGDRQWMTSDSVGTLYRVKRRPGDKDSIHQPHLPSGTWYLCTEHTGDNHYAYRTVITYGDDVDIIYLKLGKAFSMYGGGNRRCHYQLTNRDFHLLMAGEKIMIQSGVRQ